MSHRRSDAPAWPCSSARSAGPLAGVRVLDLSRVLAGPLATMQLADFGADVIKVESPGRGDETRRFGPPFMADGTAAYYAAVNRNKRSLTLDLASPGGSRVARRLALAADIMVDNFLPGRLARFGLDPGDLRAGNPGLISATVSGFGSGNEYSGRPGFDFLAQAMGGVMAITGQSGGEPTRVGVAIADILAGLHAVNGILAALAERAGTGRGRHVDVALLDSSVAMLMNLGMSYLALGIETPRFGNSHPSIAPYETLRVKDGEIAIAVGTDRQFSRLAVALGLPELAADPRFAGNGDRVRNRADLAERLQARLATGTKAHWLELLVAADVPVAPVNSIPEVFADPVVRARMVTSIGGIPQVRSPVRLDGEPMPVQAPPPALGQHTAQILAAMGEEHAL
jgi:crotonobetainyl-CoA:carnitine CoA-transferase CaiB-like acyl-CoA transferase